MLEKGGGAPGRISPIGEKQRLSVVQPRKTSHAILRLPGAIVQPVWALVRAILSLPLLIGFLLVGLAYDRENRRRWGR